jgi:hypothetical protein
LELGVLSRVVAIHDFSFFANFIGEKNLIPSSVSSIRSKIVILIATYFVFISKVIKAISSSALFSAELMTRVDGGSCICSAAE